MSCKHHLAFRCSANEHVAVTMNYMTRYASFNFASFVWTKNFTWPIYVHCSVCTCDTESPGVNCTALVRTHLVQRISSKNYESWALFEKSTKLLTYKEFDFSHINNIRDIQLFFPITYTVTFLDVEGSQI